ncbi:MAG TPA: FtsX-like permease family protein [Streptosporangiaceae bacterium]
MLAAMLASLWAHKRRLLMSSLAIVLGVGFVSGTFVLSDTLKSSFYSSFSSTGSGVGAVVRHGGAHGVPAGALDRIRALPQVAAADGTVEGVVTVVRPDGTPVSSGNLPGMLASVPSDQRLRSVPVTRGSPPSGSRQIVVDETTAGDAHIAIGDRLRVVGRDGDHGRIYRVTGFTKAGAYSGAGLGMSPSQAARVLKATGYERVDVAGAGIGQDELKQRLSGALGGAYAVTTGTAEVHKQADDATSATKPITIGLLMFAFVALLVAALVIFNTFQILVAQRATEMALLRCVGATRRQVFGSVVAESAIMGLVASVIGVAAGIGIGTGMLALFHAFQETVPVGVPPFELGTSLLAVGVGLVVTMVAAIIPALRATRIAPIAALRTPDQPRTRRAGPLRVATIAVFGAGGLALAVGGAVYGDVLGMIAVAAGGCVFFVAVLAAGPLYIPPLARLIGAIPARAGVPGRLAVANTVRNPGRTAATAAALTIGITLVTLFSVVGASAKASVDERIADRYPVDYMVRSATSDSIAPGAIADLRARPEIGALAVLRSAYGTVNGAKTEILGMSGTQVTRLTRRLATEGSLAALRPGTTAISADYAARTHLKTGDRLTVRTPRGGTSTPRIVAVYDSDFVSAPVALSTEAFAHGFGAVRAGQGLMNLRPGVTDDQGRRAVDAVLRQYPDVQAPSVAQIREQLSSSVNALLGVVSGLLGLAIIIAVFGIANTLSLSVLERTRESALVRALGLTKRQLRRMLSVEAGVTAVVGAVLGVLLGIGFGRAVVAAIAEMSAVKVFAVSYTQIAIFVVVAGGCGWLASILPARRAARASIVSAITDE